jgi:hypothetical protein
LFASTHAQIASLIVESIPVDVIDLHPLRRIHDLSVHHDAFPSECPIRLAPSANGVTIRCALPLPPRQ